MKDFKNFSVWKKAHLLTLEVYKLTRTFPNEEIYGIISQMRRASVSIPANIAEGCGKNSEAEFIRFLNIASGSASELEYHLFLSRELTYLSEKDHEYLEEKIKEIKRMLTGLVKRISIDNSQRVI